MRWKKLASFVDVDDTTPIQKLTVLEQLRVLIRRVAQEDKEQLKAEDAETVYSLHLQADLLEFLHKATEEIRAGKHSRVCVLVSSKFLPVLDVVLESSSISTYYNTKVSKPEVEFDIDYFITIILEVKAY